MSARRFSIVITCYNQRDFIRAAVHSALMQRHPAKEIIVVDDDSNDGSRQILEQYGELINLVKFTSNRGAIDARNHGANCATGECLVFLDGDDLFMPWALDVYERIVADRNPKIIQAACTWFEGEIPPLRDQDFPRKIEFVDYRALLEKDRPFGFSASTFVVDRQTFQEAGGWSPGIFQLDLIDLAIKLGYSGHTVLVSSPPTIFYRVHESNSIHTVPPFLQMAYRLMNKERMGEYPGGPERRFARYAQLGGMATFWTRRALHAGLYKDALRLAVSGLPMILAALVRRSLTYVRRRRPIETIDMPRA